MYKMSRIAWYYRLLRLVGIPPYNLRLPALVEPDEDSFFAWVPGWDDVYAPGDTEKEALDNLVITAIAVYKSYRCRGMVIPYPSGFNKEEGGRNTRFFEINVPIYA